LLSISSGSMKKLLRVTVPPGSRDGTLLRLAGAGQQVQDGTQEDLYLRVEVR
jgi:DnaJ-class molecular chaperone